MRTHCKVKICGLTRRRDVELAVELGAEYVGFVLAPASPRHVPPELLPELTRGLPEHVRRVGVFVNEPAETIRRIAAVSSRAQISFRHQNAVGQSSCSNSFNSCLSKSAGCEK